MYQFMFEKDEDKKKVLHDTFKNDFAGNDVIYIFLMIFLRN